ncbi:MAG: hypothetical protein C3F02_01500 [Parcubacteria group bacterium]|nr:MAG: hypothetical protein C3F02_01500 [Parcubacteria group bacterium]
MAQNKNKTQIKNRALIFGVFFAILLVFWIVPRVQAATIYPSPTSGSYDVGKTFNVGVYLSSADQAANAVSGTLSFPSDKLEVTGVSKSGSIINLWVQDPSYSAGTVSFEGIVLNPGFKGSGGKIISVSFKTKSPGTANLTFTSGSVLANDGQGTNILSGFGSASFGVEVPTIGPAAPEAETPAVASGVLLAPPITSETHPNPDSWYNNNKAIFSWQLPAGTTATQLLVGEKPQVTPTVTYSPAIATRALDALDDGVWYLHVRLKNANGWGGITHFRFQIDTKNPDFFNMKVLEEADKTIPTRTLSFEAADEMSGISHYEIQIDDGESQKWIDDGSHKYTTPALGPGRHVLIARAVDKAGNYLSSFNEFFIDALQPPQITDYSKELTAGSMFVAKGTAYPNSQVVVWLQKDKADAQSATVSSDKEGKFTFIADQKLADGLYQLWAEVIDQRGAKSSPSEKLTVMVQPPKIVRVGSWVVSILSVIIPLIALVFLLVFMLIFSYRKWSIMRGRVRREVGEAESVLHKEFNNLRKRIRAHLKILEQVSKKKKLTKEEQLTMEELRQELASAEHNVEKEIEDIRREVNKK